MVIPLAPGPEFDLIRRFLAARPPGADDVPGVRVGPGDDCAVVVGNGIAVTVDMSIEDVHFRRAWLDPAEIGWRATAASLSDLAAMAARPIGILASVALGPDDDGTAAGSGPGEALLAGIAAAAHDAGAALIGGDLARSPGPLVVDIVALGEAPDPVMRGGARAGDEVWVTGRLGAAAAAVAAWLAGGDPDPEARRAFARPRPRVAEALWLAERHVPSAMIDLSDGLAGDAAHIAAASGVRVVIEAAAIPVAPAAAAAADPVALAAGGGEDYELCFTAAPGTANAVRDAFEEAFGLPLTRVGRVETGEGCVVVNGEGEPMKVSGWQHWGRTS